MGSGSIPIFLKNLGRALRLPFAAVSVSPFILGTLLAGRSTDGLSFLVGLGAVIATHLSSNLLNDYADSKTGVDWQDREYYAFFGGSKLIQESVFSERFYRNTAILLALVSASLVLLLAVRQRSLAIIGYYAAILFLAWSYSCKPLQLSYHRLGEAVIFLLFGPVLVMGGYFIQTQVFPTLKGFVLSLPFGFLTAAVLVGNEVPGFAEDEKAGKHTGVSLVGQARGYLIFGALVCAAYASILLAMAPGYLGRLSLLAFLGIPLTIKSASILKRHYDNKTAARLSSMLAIVLHVLVSSVLILDVFL